MLQLIYLSTPRRSWDGRFDLLCAQAAENNARDEITGVLLQHGGTFLQILEGPQVTVEDTFIRIITDPRHHALELLSRRKLTRREFGEWAMAGVEGGHDCAEAIDHVARIIADDHNAGALLRQRLRG